MNDFRVGIGQDSHKFSTDPDRKLFLGGIEVLDEIGLEGNSDADVVIHAICRALEQAIGGESFSVYADEMNGRGITDSKEYLKVSVAHVKEKGFRINNVGISVEAKRPNISKISESIKNSLSPILEISNEDIGISATSGEEMTPFGKGEGVQAFAIVSLSRTFPKSL
jgi:2-C-methyl-D-erythritol 2,4-cyclodiphosphate synthase